MKTHKEKLPFFFLQSELLHSNQLFAETVNIIQAISKASFQSRVLILLVRNR